MTHLLESVSRPGLEPVYDACTDKPREVATPQSQFVATGGHGQHYVQVVSALAQEELMPCDATFGDAGYNEQTADGEFTIEDPVS